MYLTGPEHAERAEALLNGQLKWPHRIPDRMTAANAHATLALVSLIAHTLTAEENTVPQQEVDARHYEWRMALPFVSPYSDPSPPQPDLDSETARAIKRMEDNSYGE